MKEIGVTVCLWFNFLYSSSPFPSSLFVVTFLLTRTDWEEINIVQIRDDGTRFNTKVLKKS
jgi:hypothetical protein